MKYTGIVTTYFSNRSFGFIKSDHDASSRFFHASYYQGQPCLGVRVEFELAPPTRIGKDEQAVNIHPIEVRS